MKRRNYSLSEIIAAGAIYVALEILFPSHPTYQTQTHNSTQKKMGKLETALSQFCSALRDCNPKWETTSKSLWPMILSNSIEKEQRGVLGHTEQLAFNAIRDVMQYLNEGRAIRNGDYVHQAIEATLEKISRIKEEESNGE
jgi:hypothetical protein